MLNLGNGSTWPGHIALLLNKNFVSDLIDREKTKVIFVTGTNGKTTTAKLIKTILVNNKKTAFVNKSGANLLNGIASSLIFEANFLGKINSNYAIFEIDENALYGVAKAISPDYVIALNLFRDQLDRYGEINKIIKNWKNIYNALKDHTIFILNADDPQIAYLGLGKEMRTLYFGLNDVRLKSEIHQRAADSILCPRCLAKLIFNPTYYSHLGNWSCPNCKLKRPMLNIEKSNIYPLEGIYNRYNVLATVLLAKDLGIKSSNIDDSLKEFKPAFGRQETLTIDKKKVKFFLAKNPTSFNESLKTIRDAKAKNLFIILNDRIPDGTDVSWIWDIDFEILLDPKTNITISGDRTYDMALRLKYADVNKNYKADNNLKTAVDSALSSTQNNETLYILPTYSAMLEVRKLLTGKKIL